MKTRLNLLLFGVIATSLLVGITGCKKDTPAGTQFTFSYTGNPCRGDTLYFKSTAPTGSSFLWNFGDGSTSTAAAPYHIYSDSGMQNVTLIVNNNYATQVKKPVNIFVDPLYTDSLCQINTWFYSVVKFGNGYQDSLVSDYAYVMPIAYVNAVSIAIHGDTILYNEVSSYYPYFYYMGTVPDATSLSKTRQVQVFYNAQLRSATITENYQASDTVQYIIRYIH